MAPPRSTRICSIEGCSRKHAYRGWCSAHAQRWRITGSPTTPFTRARSGHGMHVSNFGYRILARKKLEHIAVVEKAIGKRLPRGAEVHHLNEIKTDNRPENLVVFPDHAYHMLLHCRAKAMAAGFPAHWRKCGLCHNYDDPQNMRPVKRSSYKHRACDRAYGKLYRQRVVMDLTT